MMITDDDLAVLREWHAAESRISQRAEIVLLSSNGKALGDVAKSVGTSARVVRTWLERYRRLGLAGLVEEKRSGRPITDKQLKAIVNFLSNYEQNQAKESVEEFARRIKRSPDVVWRASRLLGGGAARNGDKVELDVDCKIVRSGLLGLFLTERFFVAAFHEGLSMLPDDHPFESSWLSPPRKILKAVQDTGVNLALSKALLASPAVSRRILQSRPTSETWRRWLAGLIRAEPRVAKSLLFLVTGNMNDPRIFGVLRLSHEFKTRNRARLREGDTVPPVVTKLFVSPERWLDQVSVRLDPFLDERFAEWMSPWIEKVTHPGFFAWLREPQDF